MRVSRLGFGAAFSCAMVLATGCGRTWPAVRAVGDVEFLQTGGVRTVDVLPLDVGISTSPETPEPPEIVAERFTLLAAGEVESHLVERGYLVTAFIDRQGMFERGDERLWAMTPEALEETQASLAGYGTAQSHVRGSLLTPYLPARLGTATGADATLYVGGYAFAGRDDHGVDAGDVAKVIVLALFIVVVVTVVAIVARKSGGGGGGGGGHAVSGGSFGRAAGNAGGALGHAGGVATRGLGRAVAHGGYHVMRGFASAADAWGRTDTHITVWAANPPGPLPMTGSSQTVLEMTLVDNRRGLVLWHAHQEFPANPAVPGDVRQAVRRMLDGLPKSR